jgi:enterobactin synthetase component D
MAKPPDQLVTPHGACTIVELDDAALGDALASLPAAEQEHARTLGDIRRRELIAGRTALHLALADFTHAILADDRGAPILPAGWVGSVSHKGSVAAAIIAPAGAGWVGIDLEHAAAPRLDIARRILTAREQAELPDRGPAVTLRFAIKEAIYKAIDPMLRRYVGFTEVELAVGEGTCVATSQLPVAIDAAWRAHAQFWLATARATQR